MKSIDTTYNGRRYRSRLEARWAVFFDRAWIRFDYELQGYELPSGPYLPDFFLRKLEPPNAGDGYWIEIKPTGLATDRALRRVQDLCIETGKDGFLVAGNPWPGEFATWKFSRLGGLIDLLPADRSKQWPFIPSDWFGCLDVPWDFDSATVIAAFHASRRTRFEHGESAA